jgi:enamine deaminase RidA (YjgF/YER057c/UK114 family)
MPVEKMNPPTLSEPQGFMHVGIATGSRLVFLAGQVAQSTAGELVGAGDLAAQTEQALLNVGAGLDAAGATFDDVAKLTLYVVDWDEGKMEQLMAGVMRAAERLNAAPLVPSTLVPVPRLFQEGYLIELDVTAVLP